MTQSKPLESGYQSEDSDEHHTARPLERRVGGGHGSDGIRAEISLE